MRGTARPWARSAWWLAARRLNAGRFVWPAGGAPVGLSREQLDALVLGLTWQRLGDAGIIRVI